MSVPPDALKRTLLDAKVVAYTAEGQSRATVNKALAQLGITAGGGREIDAHRAWRRTRRRRRRQG